MRTLFALVFLCILGSALSQSPLPCEWYPHDPDWGEISLIANSSFYLSSEESSLTAVENIIDGNISTIARTREETNPFLHIDLEHRSYVPYIILYSSELFENFYIFMSPMGFERSVSMSSLLSSNFITTNQVLNYNSGDTIFINDDVKSIRIQFQNVFSLELSELIIPGSDVVLEICNNQLDDNCDGKVDCEDNDCGIIIQNVSKIDASCPICYDGEIHIQSNGNNKEFSIDGGATFNSLCWDDFENMCFWKGLLPGEYDIVVRNSVSNCYAYHTETITISYPPPGEHGPCFNGGFEDGDFEMWKGGLGLYSDFDDTVLPPVLDITNQNFDIINGRHSIIYSNAFVDPLVPEINGLFGALGQYFARLGNANTQSEAERLTYCMTVDNLNSEFYFVYALVVEDPIDPPHSDEQKPFLSWRIYNATTPNTPYFSFNVEADRNDEYFEVINSNDPDVFLLYKGWTCQYYDLSPYIGEDICIEFNVADCSMGEHFGYAYIDALCGFHDEYTPTAIIEIPEAICADQDVAIKVLGGGYNRYQWTISKLDLNGNTFETVILPEKSEIDASIEDLRFDYEWVSNYTMNCNQRYRATLIVYNECDDYTTEVEFNLLCENIEVEYCDIITVCDSESDVRLQGENDCTNCTLEWYPEEYLIFDDPLYPRLNVDIYPESLDQTYSVTVTSPLGCVYEQEIIINQLNRGEIEPQLMVDYCDFTAIGKLILTSPANNNYAEMVLRDVNTLEEFPMSLVPEQSDSYLKVYTITLPRDRDYMLEFVARIDGTYCVLGSQVCEIVEPIQFIPKSSFLGPWIVELPNLFAPGSNDPAKQLWWPSIYSEDLEDCENASDVYNNIYGFKLLVRDRWGGELYYKEVFRDVYDDLGVQEIDIAWDGKVDGQIVEQGVYVFHVWVYSCYGTAGFSECYNYHCPCDNVIDCNYDVCGNNEENYYTFDVTIL